MALLLPVTVLVCMEVTATDASHAKLPRANATIGVLHSTPATYAAPRQPESSHNEYMGHT